MAARMSEELKNQLEEKRAKAMECRDSFRDFKRSAPQRDAFLLPKQPHSTFLTVLYFCFLINFVFEIRRK